MTDSLRDWIGHPLRPVEAYGAYEVVVDDDDALALWRKLCGSASEYWPVFVDRDHSLTASPPSRDQLTATLQDAQRIFDDLLVRDERMGRPHPVGPGSVLTTYMLANHDREPSWAGLRGALQADRELRVPDSALDRYDEDDVEADEPDDDQPSWLDEDSGRDVRLWIVPARANWSLPAVFDFGGFNACPQSSSHVAHFRLWAQRYGARVLAIGGDWLEAEVERPPQSARAAPAPALEHRDYCSGDGQELPLEETASGLLTARHWFFWWD